jgi:hypothetical protein
VVDGLTESPAAESGAVFITAGVLPLGFLLRCDPSAEDQATHLEQCMGGTMPALPPPLTFLVAQRQMPRRCLTLPQSGNGVAYPKVIKGVGRPRPLGLATPVRYGPLPSNKY